MFQIDRLRIPKNMDVSKKVKIVRLYSKTENAQEVRRILFEEQIDAGIIKRGHTKIDEANIPTNTTILRINRQFDEAGTVIDQRVTSQKHTRPKRVTTVENIAKVREEVMRSPDVSKSHRRLSDILGMHPSSIYQILKELKLKPYIPRLHQQLNEDDPDKRLEFCEIWQGLLKDDNQLPMKILWSDEAKFHLDGGINRHNCVYWATDNPHKITTAAVNSPGVTVWCGLNGDQILGPIFFDTTVTGDSYLSDVLATTVFPYFEQQDDGNELIFQQDGAPPHYANVVRAALNDKLEGRWLGRRGAIEWPARSPDLTPLDFFFWGYLKNKVYSVKQRTLVELKDSIRHHICNLNHDKELLKRVAMSVNDRIRKCINVDGGHFEHLQ